MNSRTRKRDAFLQQPGCGLQPQIGHEPTLHRLAMEQMTERQQTHPVVVRHPGADNGERFTGGHACGCVVHRLVQAEAADRSGIDEASEVADGFHRFNHQGQGARIGRNHKIVCQTALHAEHRDAEGTILIGLARVQLVVSRLGNTPGDARLPAVADLAVHRAPAGHVQKRTVVNRHDQHRHQVLEHRAAPRGQHGRAPARCKPASEVEPVFQRQLTAGHADIAAQAALRRQKIVEAGIPMDS